MTDDTEQIPVCGHGLLKGPLPALGDPEGPRLPSALAPVIDAHVHLFPPRVFEAIWRWFEAHGWPIRYRLHTPDVVEFLLSRGVERVVALTYAHKPGMAAALNTFMADVCRDEPRIIGLGTVFPGEPGAKAIVSDALDAGLAGIKLHCHVQCMSADDPRLEPVYQVCAERGAPVVIHAGREPKSPAYACDPHALCHVDRVEAVLRSYPSLKLVVPHLGLDEYTGYERLLGRYDNLWLDTTMVVADYFPIVRPTRLVTMRPERVMYGTDFPNIPYAWDREIIALRDHYGLTEPALAQVLGETAASLYGVAATR